MIKDTINTFQDSGTIPEETEDPFMDQIEPLLIGQAFYKLEPLAYMIDNPVTISIISPTSQVIGRLDINIVPVDQDGESDIPDDLIPDSPQELIGQRMDFIVQIQKATELPPDFCKDVFCEYTFFIGEEKYTTIQVKGKNQNPEFNYRFHHTVEYCSENFIQYLQKESVSSLLYITILS